MCHQLNHLPQDFGHVARVMVKDPICVDEGHQDSVSVVLLSVQRGCASRDAVLSRDM